METVKRTLKNEKTKKIEYKQVDGTPFTIVKNDDEYIIVIGDTAVTTEKFKTNADALKYIETKSWELLANTICIIAKKINEYENTIKKNDEK